MLDSIRGEDWRDLWANYLEAVKHEKKEDLQVDDSSGVLQKLEVVTLRLRHLRLRHQGQ